jgi:hypothetical protein
MSALGFECVKVALKQDRTGFVLTLSIHPDEIPEELMRDFVGARYMCALARVNDDETAKQYNNLVKEAAMLCKSPSFFDWLKYESVITKGDHPERYENIATQWLYDICEITSRTELNGSVAARERFKEMVEQYAEWNKQNDPF